MRRALLLATLLAAQPLPGVLASDGSTVFAEHCADCHTLGHGRARRGPPLAGIVGKPAAGVATYRYSDAMRQAQIVWSRERLGSFLADPRADLPGTRMRMRKELSQTELAALLNYLEISARRAQ